MDITILPDAWQPLKIRNRKAINGIVLVSLFMDTDDAIKNILSLFQYKIGKGTFMYQFISYISAEMWNDDLYLQDLIERCGISNK